MFKVVQGLTLQQSSKHPGLVRRFLHGHQVLNFTEGHHPLDPILCLLHPSLEIANCQEYLEPQAGLSGSMRNSNLIHSDLSASGPSTLSIFFTLETKGIMGGEDCCTQNEAKQRRIWKPYSWPLSGLKFFSRSVITVLYVESTITIYDLLQTISRIGSCMSNRDVT
jgi:hypothetical protein